MPRVAFDNHGQAAVVEQLFGAGQSIAVSSPVTWDAGTAPEHLDRVQCGLVRNRDPAGSIPGGAASIRITLGLTEFAADLFDAQVYPDWLPYGQAMTYTVPVDADLSEAARTGGIWVTLWAPVTRNVGTLHVEDAAGALGAARLRTLAGDFDHPHPLWMLVEGYSAAVATGTLALQDVDHQAFTDVLSGGHLRKRTRITVWEVDFPLGGPPYRRVEDLPVLRNPTVLNQVTNYQISTSDKYQSDTLSLDMALGDYERLQSILVENCMITVDEQWGNAEQSMGWVRKGTFFMDDAQDRLDSRTRTVSVRARDAMKLTLLQDVQRKVWPDLIHVARKRLVAVNDPKRDLDCFYLLVDGTEEAHTYLWAEFPKPRLWVVDKGTRIEQSTGKVDIDHRDGEVLIERAFYEGGIFYEGLGNPKWIEAEYWRIARPEDESFTVVQAALGHSLTVAMEGSDRWLGCTLVVLSGQGAYGRYRVVSVTGPVVTVDGTPADDGVASGDRVQIVVAARVEQTVYDMLIASGFQDLDPASPFYIERIARPGDVVSTLPADQAFDFSSNRLRPISAVLEEIRKWIPPDVLYHTNSLGNAVTLFMVQKETGEYEIGEPSRVAVARSDSDVFTRVVYQARDRSYINILSENSPYVRSASCPDPSANQYLHYQPAEHLSNLAHAGDRVPRMLTDGRIRTAVMWLYDFPPQELEGGAFTRLDGKVLVQWEMEKLTYAKDLILTGINRPWAAGQQVDVQVTDDGAQWVSVDNVIFGGASEPQTLDLTDFPFIMLRLVATGAAYVGVDLAAYGSFVLPPQGAAPPITLYPNQFPTPPATTTRILPGGIVLVGQDTFVIPTTTKVPGGIPKDAPKQAGIGISKVELYLNDIVEGIVELGVDRFEGESDAQFADDVFLRERLGRRTLTVQGVDERGYEISRALNASVESYARARAAEYLSEVVSAFDQAKTSEVRPDHTVGDTATINAERLALGSVSYLTKEVNYSGDGTNEATAVNYRPARALVLPLVESALTRHCDPDKFPPSTTTILGPSTTHVDFVIHSTSPPSSTATVDTRTTGTSTGTPPPDTSTTPPPTASTTTSCITTDYPWVPPPPDSIDCLEDTTVNVSLYQVNVVPDSTYICEDVPCFSWPAMFASVNCYRNGTLVGTVLNPIAHASFSIDMLCPDDVIDFEGIINETATSFEALDTEEKVHDYWCSGTGVWPSSEVTFSGTVWARGAPGRRPGYLQRPGCFDLMPLVYGLPWTPGTPLPEEPHYTIHCEDTGLTFFVDGTDIGNHIMNPTPDAALFPDPDSLSYSMYDQAPQDLVLTAQDPRYRLTGDDHLSTLADVWIWRAGLDGDFDPTPVQTTMGTALSAAHPNPWTLVGEGPGFVRICVRDRGFDCWGMGIPYLTLGDCTGWMSANNELGNDDALCGDHIHPGPAMFGVNSDCDTTRSLPVGLRTWLAAGGHRMSTRFWTTIAAEDNYFPNSGWVGQDADTSPTDMTVYDQGGTLHRAQDVGPPPGRAYVLRVSDGALLYWDGQNLFPADHPVEQ